MPTGHLGHIGLVVEIMMRAQPKSILDVGIGYGKYGMLAREYLDYAHFKGRAITIDGIEGFGEYVQEGQRFYYDKIFIGDARSIIPSLGQYDMILLLDVLEHFSEEDGLQILSVCQSKAKHVVVATPKDMGIQGAVYGNEFERHQFQWTRKILSRFSPITFFRNPVTLFAILGDGGLQFKRQINYRNFKVRLRANLPIVYFLYKKIKKVIAS